MTYHCPRDLVFPWQPYFDRHVFNLKIKQKLSYSIFKSVLGMSLLFVLITFEPILEVFLRFWTNPEIQDSGSFRNDYAIITSCGIIPP